MTCITQEDIQSTLVDMKEFYNELKSMYSSHGMNLEDNLGRRNILMSMVQEEFLARTLNKRYDSVVADGAPGRLQARCKRISRQGCHVQAQGNAEGKSFVGRCQDQKCWRASKDQRLI